jgi:plasmid maintenance system antidote protein VapI
MALRLASAFDTTAESWLIQQMHYDLWRTRQQHQELNIPLLLAA